MKRKINQQSFEQNRNRFNNVNDDDDEDFDFDYDFDVDYVNSFDVVVRIDDDDYVSNDLDNHLNNYFDDLMDFAVVDNYYYLNDIVLLDYFPNYQQLVGYSIDYSYFDILHHFPYIDQQRVH